MRAINDKANQEGFASGYVIATVVDVADIDVGHCGLCGHRGPWHSDGDCSVVKEHDCNSRGIVRRACLFETLYEDFIPRMARCPSMSRR